MLKKKIEYLLFPCQRRLDEVKDEFKETVKDLCTELENCSKNIISKKNYP